jgi:hypothetical protein
MKAEMEGANMNSKIANPEGLAAYEAFIAARSAAAVNTSTIILNADIQTPD